MTKRVVFLTVSLAVLVLSGLSLEAEPVPKRATGIWSLGPCGGDGLLSRAELSRGRRAAKFFFDYRWPITVPSRMFKAANSVVVPLR